MRRPLQNTRRQILRLTDSSDSESETDNETDNDTSNEIDNETDHEDETSLLLSPSVHKKTFTVPEETKGNDSSDKEEYPLLCPNSTSEDALFTDSHMAQSDIADLQREMVDLQRLTCRQMEAAQATLAIQHVAETSAIKPTLFHGYENENFERWMEKFRLHLDRRRINTDSPTALAELALHLSGPAESFFRSLSGPNKHTLSCVK